MHKKGVLHRDISANNLLLDAELDIKLSELQGRLLAWDGGEAEEDGLSVENTKSFLPRDDSNHADSKTEISAIESAFVISWKGQEPYPDLDPDHEEEQIVERFKSGQFPNMTYSSMNLILHKCWAGKYDSVCEVLGEFDKGLMAEDRVRGKSIVTTRERSMRYIYLEGRNLSIANHRTDIKKERWSFGQHLYIKEQQGDKR